MEQRDLNSLQQDLSHIRTMMEQNTRFMSLSGLSGVSAGVTALISAGLAWQYMRTHGLYGRVYASETHLSTTEHATFLLLLGLATLAVALAFSTFFSVRMARKRQQTFWNAAAQRLLINMLIPLGIGGAFCLILLWHSQLWLISGATLLFYGMALFNSGKYTIKEIRILGLIEMFLGLAACLWPGFGLVVWALGFGLMHIVYGIYLYFRYERTAA